jgi:hypothetical protein
MNAKITTADEAIEAMHKLEQQFGGQFVSIESIRGGKIVQGYGIHNFGKDADGCEAIRQAAEAMGLRAMPNMVSWHKF